VVCGKKNQKADTCRTCFVSVHHRGCASEKTCPDCRPLTRRSPPIEEFTPLPPAQLEPGTERTWKVNYAREAALKSRMELRARARRNSPERLQNLAAKTEYQNIPREEQKSARASLPAKALRSEYVREATIRSKRNRQRRSQQENE
jgi:hypothetical protein